jgi:hypothetical protein
MFDPLLPCAWGRCRFVLFFFFFLCSGGRGRWRVGDAGCAFFFFFVWVWDREGVPSDVQVQSTV